MRKKDTYTMHCTYVYLIIIWNSKTTKACVVGREPVKDLSAIISGKLD